MIETTPIEDALSDLVSSFLYYDRKEDPDLPLGAIERAIENGETSVEGLCSQFKSQLRDHMKVIG